MQERPLGPDRAGLPDWLLGGPDTIARDVKTVLFVGAGRHQRRAILRAKELGLRVVAVDRNPEAPGLQVADVGEAVDFTDVAAVTEVARRHGVDGVLTVSADRAVPVVAAVAEALGLPGIGTETAHLMTHKIAMRRTLADAGVPQPRFAGARDMQSARAALDAVGVPAVLKPADSGGQRGIFYVESEDELDAHLHAALAESPTDEAIVESFHDGLELNGIVIARGGEAFPLTLSDRLRPAGDRLRRRLDPRLPGVDLRRRARRGGAGRGPRGARARAARRDRVPAADRLRRRLGAGRRGRGADPRRPDGRPRPPRRRRRPRRGRAAAGARRGGARRARAAAVQAAARDPLPHRPARAAADGQGAIDRVARAGARGRGRRPGGHLPPGRRDDPAGAARRRPPRLRDRDRRHVGRGARSGPRRRRGCWRWRSE